MVFVYSRLYYAVLVHLNLYDELSFHCGLGVFVDTLWSTCDAHWLQPSQEYGDCNLLSTLFGTEYFDTLALFANTARKIVSVILSAFPLFKQPAAVITWWRSLLQGQRRCCPSKHIFRFFFQLLAVSGNPGSCKVVETHWFLTRVLAGLGSSWRASDLFVSHNR